jgi:hypothetical protein
MNVQKLLGLAAFVGLGPLLTGCGRDDAAQDGMPGMEMPAAEESMPGMGGADAEMQRHARELDEMSARMRAHLQEMRQLPPEAQHARMGEHVARGSEMLSLMNRQLREMDMGMGMSDEAMGGMMGMSGEEYRRMRAEMEALRTELEQLQTAPRAAVGERMPAHLARMEHMLHTMEEMAGHMREG